MNDDENDSAGNQETRMLELPSWLVEKRRNQAHSRKQRSESIPQDPAPTDEVSSAETMAIELSSDPGGPNSEGVGETQLLDAEQLRRRQQRRQNASCSPSKAQVPEDHLLDAGRARPVDWNRLQRVSQAEQRGLQQLFSILPPRRSLPEIETAVEHHMSELLETPHQVEFIGAGTAMSSGRSVDIPDGIWTWGKMPPEHRRFVAGAQQRLAEGWLKVAEADENVVGDNFQFGICTFLIAEFCGVFAQQIDWPPLEWAVNPMSQRDLRALLLAGELPVLEVTFGVQLDGVGGGAVRLWLPMKLVRRLQTHVSPSAADLQKEELRWWKDITTTLPVIGGEVSLRRAEFQRLRIGDVVIVDRHAMAVDGVSESAVDAAARLVVADDRAITGQLVAGEDDSWKFRTDGAQLLPTNEEEIMTADTEKQDDSPARQTPINTSVKSTSLTLQIQLGSLEIELSTLSQLRTGQVLDCDRKLGSPVDLVVQGACVGQAELVDVDGRLGVRILELTAGASGR